MPFKSKAQGGLTLSVPVVVRVSKSVARTLVASRAVAFREMPALS
jgi:hypothetical protein